MPLLIDDSNIKIKSINKTILRKTVTKTMKYLRIQQKYINIVFISNFEMKKLNYKYLKINKPTDVLSFNVDGYDKALLGDIFISLEYAKKNCSLNNNSLIKEVKILSIHGILHLMGYDHKKKSNEKEMFELQSKLYEKFK